ncbi:MAG: hypothetical protein FJ147_03100 [Deltaproteobacteria bacterium]|nr:hypothetical protein [Deltaproteobacteria bacterium]
MQYQCPRCGNTKQFVQYQWQLRKLAVDGDGASLTPDEVCANDVVAAIACSKCNTHVRDFGVDINIRFPYGTGPLDPEAL